MLRPKVRAPAPSALYSCNFSLTPAQSRQITAQAFSCAIFALYRIVALRTPLYQIVPTEARGFFHRAQCRNLRAIEVLIDQEKVRAGVVPKKHENSTIRVMVTALL